MLIGLPPGAYLGVLSHSGSRALGANIARHFTDLAMKRTRLPKEARHLAWLSLAFGVAAQGRSPAWFIVANLLVGTGVAWTLGPQLSFMRLAPQERMAQVTGTMIAVLITAVAVLTILRRDRSRPVLAPLLVLAVVAVYGRLGATGLLRRSAK